ncbi:MAG: hypothetical protein K0Q74_1007 [Gammaproteobacteria bacterium]|jgi:hypothetical protein|nr:hypothetical protein [Gammaproteobacteria bacterium]
MPTTTKIYGKENINPKHNQEESVPKAKKNLLSRLLKEEPEKKALHPRKRKYIGENIIDLNKRQNISDKACEELINSFSRFSLEEQEDPHEKELIHLVESLSLEEQEEQHSFVPASDEKHLPKDNETKYSSQEVAVVMPAYRNETDSFIAELRDKINLLPSIKLIKNKADFVNIVQKLYFLSEDAGKLDKLRMESLGKYEEIEKRLLKVVSGSLEQRMLFDQLSKIQDMLDHAAGPIGEYKELCCRLVSKYEKCPTVKIDPHVKSFLENCKRQAFFQFIPQELSDIAMSTP